MHTRVCDGCWVFMCVLGQSVVCVMDACVVHASDVLVLHTFSDADKSKEKMMAEKLQRETLNGVKDVAQSNYNTETTAYNTVLLASALDY
jgi:hypothetical protein